MGMMFSYSNSCGECSINPTTMPSRSPCEFYCNTLLEEEEYIEQMKSEAKEEAKDEEQNTFNFRSDKDLPCSYNDSYFLRMTPSPSLSMII